MDKINEICNNLNILIGEVFDPKVATKCVGNFGGDRKWIYF